MVPVVSQVGFFEDHGHYQYLSRYGTCAVANLAALEENWGGPAAMRCPTLISWATF